MTQPENYGVNETRTTTRYYCENLLLQCFISHLLIPSTRGRYVNTSLKDSRTTSTRRCPTARDPEGTSQSHDHSPCSEDYDTPVVTGTPSSCPCLGTLGLSRLTVPAWGVGHPLKGHQRPCLRVLDPPVLLTLSKRMPSPSTFRL